MYKMNIKIKEHFFFILISIAILAKIIVISKGYKVKIDFFLYMIDGFSNNTCVHVFAPLHYYFWEGLEESGSKEYNFQSFFFPQFSIYQFVILMSYVMKSDYNGNLITESCNDT